jgi:hypothetical protein
MNRAPSPEMQRQIMGHDQHMIIPGVIDHINKKGSGLGTGIKDFFKNLGNKIKGGFENQVINPVKDVVNKYIPSDVQRDIGKVGKSMSAVDLFDRMRKGEKIQDIIKDKYNTVNDVYKNRVPEDVRRDISTVSRYSSVPGLAFDVAQRLKRGERIDDIAKGQFEDLKHLNNTKNKIIKSSPALTEAYKKGVMATAGLGSAAVGTTLGLNPMAGAVLGAAGAKGAEALLKAEGYGLHHAIDHGLHRMKKSLMKHFSPIEGGSLGRGHISDFFKNAGKRVKDFAKSAIRHVEPHIKEGKQMASKLHEYILKNPKLGAKIKEHGSKLAGILAKEGIKYMGGSDDMANLVGDVSNEVGQEGFKHVGYGEEIPKYTPKPSSTPAYTTVPKQHSPLQHDLSAYDFVRQERANKGNGLYAGRQMGRGNYRTNAAATFGVNHPPPPPVLYGKGVQPPSRLVGGGVYKSFESLHNANMGYSDAIGKLARMQDRTIHGQHDTDPIKRYWDEEGAPPSRGSGLHKNHHGKVHHRKKTGYEKHNHYNLVRGRGSLIEHSELPPALQSQPYGANFHMQNMLPPQYHKYNDGTNEY